MFIVLCLMFFFVLFYPLNCSLCRPHYVHGVKAFEITDKHHICYLHSLLWYQKRKEKKAIAEVWTLHSWQLYKHFSCCESVYYLLYLRTLPLNVLVLWTPNQKCSQNTVFVENEDKKVMAHNYRNYLDIFFMSILWICLFLNLIFIWLGYRTTYILFSC